jgi:transcriptional regulator with XRE-family HTH domain
VNACIYTTNMRKDQKAGAVAKQSQKQNDFDCRQNIIDHFVAAKIRLRRLTLGMTEHEIAKAAGISIDRVRAVESGKERLGAPQLLLFSQLLDAPISWFFLGIKDVATNEYGGRLPDRAAEIGAKETLELLNHSFELLKDPENKELVMSIVNWLANREMRKAVDDPSTH